MDSTAKLEDQIISPHRDRLVEVRDLGKRPEVLGGIEIRVQLHFAMRFEHDLPGLRHDRERDRGGAGQIVGFLRSVSLGTLTVLSWKKIWSGWNSRWPACSRACSL